MSEAVIAVKQIMDEWDPFGLKPDNIYGIESMEIVKCIKSSGTREPMQIVDYLRTILQMYHRERKLNINDDEYHRIADKIIATLN